MDQSDQYIKEQIEAISQQIGQVLDFNIYHNGQPFAPLGTVITENLVRRLFELSPGSVRFSREDTHIRDRETGEIISDQEARDEAVNIALEAGIEEDLSEEVRSMATRKVKEIFESCRYLTKLDLDAAAELAANLIRRASSLTSSAFKLRDLRHHDEYTYFHSVNCCVLATTVFRELTKSENELLEFGIGILLHDIGKSKIDLKILNKPGPLSEEERDVMRRHVLYGYNLVKNNNDLSDIAKNIILNHHEWVNGAGYGRGLTESQLSVYDQVAAVVDVFDAVTTNRVYRTRMDVHRAVSLLVRGAGTQFNTRTVNHFLRGIGRFPVGTFVQLSNNEIGVVSKINTNALSLPVIRILYDNTGTKLEDPRTVNLYEHGDLYIEKPLDTSPIPYLPSIGVTVSA